MLRLSARAVSLALIASLLASGQLGCGATNVRCRPANSALPPYAETSLQAAEYYLSLGQALEATGEEQCVEAYFQACSLAWKSLPEEPNAAQCYQAALFHLLGAAYPRGRLDPARGLMIRQGAGFTTVPIVHHGFPWQATDFQALDLPPTGHEPLLSRRYGWHGIGLPLVVERSRDSRDPVESRFLPEKSWFAATMILRAPAGDDSQAVLEFYDPLSFRSVPLETGEVPLSADLSAPLAKTLEVAPRTYLAGFIEPGAATTMPRLNFLEPYQPGKVPVVLIHGLFSDPQNCWADLVNDLRAMPGFLQRYQLWGFRYPTGQGFLQSAAALRKELRAAVCQLGSDCNDPALHEIVLIGHSMGGLIAKLQVTYSEEWMWSRLANRPLEQIVTTEPTRALLAETCYFDPSPDVARVIFIASPHGGALQSSALIGRGASLFVKPSPQQAALHEQLIRDNPNTFHPVFERRFPTSIDMLTRDSPLLDAMHHTQVRREVKLHNIVGNSHLISLDGPSDGVVSVASAAHPGCVSELAIDASHTDIHRAVETTAEVLRILDVLPDPWMEPSLRSAVANEYQ